MEEKVYSYLIENHIGKQNLIKNKELRKIFDTGVTLWHTDDVGNYGLDNN